MGGRQGADRARVNGIAYRLSLCGSGTTGCHGWVESHREEAARLGYLLPRNGRPLDPARVRVLTGAATDRPAWQTFTHDGRRAPTGPPPGGDARNDWPAAAEHAERAERADRDAP